MLALEVFGFQALWSPYFLMALTCLAIAYFLLLGKFGKKFKGSEPLTAHHAVFFVSSVFLLYIVKGSPIDLMAHLMFYMHMIQMVVFVLIVPPLFIMGIPQWGWKYLFTFKVFKSLFGFFAKPLIALILFNGIFSFYHVPFIFDHVMQNTWLHAGFSILLFLLAIFMWWPLVNKLPEWQTLTGIKKVGYIFADGILLTPACALIIFSNAPIYATYADPKAWGMAMSLCVGADNFSSLHISGPELFSSMPLLFDQQLGGVIMKVAQEIIYGIFLGQVFFEWYRKDKEASEQEMNHPINPA